MAENQPVFDYFPRGTPWVVNDAIERVIDECLEAGMGSNETIRRVRFAEVEQIRNNQLFRDELETAFRSSGVNLVSPTMGRANLNDPVNYENTAFEELSMWQARIDHLNWLQKVTSPEEARDVVSDGDIGVIPNVQNLGIRVYEDLMTVDALNNAGIQIAQLAYNNQNLIGSSALERGDGGVTEHGLDVIKRLNDLGVIIDLSHCGPNTTFDAIEASETPVAFTHTVTEHVAGLARGESDEEMKALAECDGYMGFLALPTFLAPHDVDNAMEVFFEHLEHAVSIVGIDRVGIGTDWGRWTAEVPEKLRPGIEKSYDALGFEGDHFIGTNMTFGRMTRYQDRHEVMTDELNSHGYTEGEAKKILGENFVRFWERVRE